MGFHPITGWFGINNVIGWVGFNFPLVFLVGCGMNIKVIRFGYGWEWIGFFAISRPSCRPIAVAVHWSTIITTTTKVTLAESLLQLMMENGSAISHQVGVEDAGAVQRRDASSKTSCSGLPQSHGRRTVHQPPQHEERRLQFASPDGD
jgi:hypothetical protein